MTIDEQVERLRCGTVDVVPETELAAKLELAHREKRPLRVKLGADPRDPQMFGPIPPGYDHPPTLYEQMFRPPTTADRMSADYTKGELIAQCLGIVAGAVDLAAGLGSAASKVSSKLSRSAVERAADELALEVAERANAPKNLGAYAPEAKGPGLQWVRPEGGGAGTSSAGKGAGGFAGGR